MPNKLTKQKLYEALGYVQDLEVSASYKKIKGEFVNFMADQLLTGFGGNVLMESNKFLERLDATARNIIKTSEKRQIATMACNLFKSEIKDKLNLNTQVQQRRNSVN